MIHRKLELIVENNCGKCPCCFYRCQDGIYNCGMSIKNGDFSRATKIRDSLFERCPLPEVSEFNIESKWE